MKRHFCDVCKLNEITSTNGAILEGDGSLDVYYIRDEFPESPVYRRLDVKLYTLIGTQDKLKEDICKSCLKNMLLEALKS